MFSRSILASAISLTLMAHAHAAGTASSEQIGNDNLTEITQMSSQNVSATTLQNGDSNESFVNQKGYDLTIQATQRGAGNLQDIQQDGWEASAEVNQNGQSNVATVYQAPHDNAQLFVNIDQNGHGNESSIRQIDANVSSARTDQEGVDNIVDVEQRGQMSSISVVQEGDSNDVTASQTGAGASIYQAGNNNIVDLSQYTDSYANTNIDQQGSFNDARVSQWADGRWGGGNINLAQTGQNNSADISSGGSWASFTFEQTGTGNDVSANSAGTTVSVNGHQTGTNNSAEIEQSGALLSLDIAQNGSDDIIEASQTGGAYYDYTTDSGVIDQTGTANFASLTQVKGDGFTGGHSANIMQNGMNNSATVTQR